MHNLLTVHVFGHLLCEEVLHDNCGQGSVLTDVDSRQHHVIEQLLSHLCVIHLVSPKQLKVRPYNVIIKLFFIRRTMPQIVAYGYCDELWKEHICP